jgi:hypothetical protein
MVQTKSARGALPLLYIWWNRDDLSSHLMKSQNEDFVNFHEKKRTKEGKSGQLCFNSLDNSGLRHCLKKCIHFKSFRFCSSFSVARIFCNVANSSYNLSPSNCTPNSFEISNDLFKIHLLLHPFVNFSEMHIRNDMDMYCI